MTEMVLWGVFWFGCGWAACEGFTTWEHKTLKKQETEFRKLNVRVRR